MTRSEPSVPLEIGLLTSLGYNVGDDFIREGVRAVLDRIGRPYRPLYVNKLDPSSLHERREDETVAVDDKFFDADVFIQCGAPVYWNLLGGAATSLTAEWFDWIWRARILSPDRGRDVAFLNLGAGSCQPWSDQGARAFLADEACVAFAHEAGDRAALTTVRDRVASALLTMLGVDHTLLPCPAFLAGARHRPARPAGEYVAVNLMPLGGHWDLEGSFDAERWRLDCLRLVSHLRRLGPIVFVAHDAAEAAFMASLGSAADPVWQGAHWSAYLEVYGGARLAVANRVHGAVGAAGMGVPGLVVGNDTRAFIAEPVGLPILRSGYDTVDAVLEAAQRLDAAERDERARLQRLRDDTLETYADVVRRALPEPRTRAGRQSPIARASLGSVVELTSEAFRGFMSAINAFARTHGLREFTNWSKVWEYPWLWREALGQEPWPGRRLVDIGSEISPMPWFIATQGAHVTLVERDPQWTPVWERLRATLAVDVHWYVSEDDRLPLAADSADVVTSFSVVEHQRDKRLAIDEAARVLRPGGLLALSFDICEPDRGMTFPEWNGHALTIREFEDLVWRHPGFEGGADVRWNLDDIDPFLAWHRTSAPHHNYVVGAAVLRRRADGVRTTAAPAVEATTS